MNETKSFSAPASASASARVDGPARPAARAMVESVIKCKWSLTVIDLVRGGVTRPGAMERAVPGLTTKVLNERLRKFVRYGVLERRVFAEVPPRVEYQLTAFGKKFVRVLRAIDQLEGEMEGAASPPRPGNAELQLD